MQKESIHLPTQEKEIRMPGMGLRLGAAKAWEEDDHPVPRQLVSAARDKDFKYWPAGELQDQGALPHCVEYGTRGSLLASPARNKVAHIPRASIYNWCQQNDEWEGTNYDGTSVHAACKWLKANGYIDSYTWAKSVAEVHAHLMLKGTVLLGTTWWEHMSYVDGLGYARVGGRNFGGHCYLARGRNRLIRDPLTNTLGRTTIRNSWGKSYGLKGSGEAYINDKDLQILIDDWGEAALFVEKLVKVKVAA